MPDTRRYSCCCCWCDWSWILYRSCSTEDGLIHLWWQRGRPAKHACLSSANKYLMKDFADQWSARSCRSGLATMSVNFNRSLPLPTSRHYTSSDRVSAKLITRPT